MKTTRLTPRSANCPAATHRLARLPQEDQPARLPPLLRLMNKEREPEEQLSFIAPRDAAVVHMLRRFVAEADRIYHDETGRSLEESLTISCPADGYAYLRGEMAELEREQIRVLTLTVKNTIISAPMIYQGTISGTHVRVAEIFRPAIIDNAAAVLVAHNHPSGDPEPSAEDIHITRKIVEAGRLLDVDVLDHIIISSSGFVSMRERGLGFVA
jgi:DNA repair protein RadC